MGNVFHLYTLLKCQSLLEVAEIASSGMYQQPTSLRKSIAEILHLEKLTKGHFGLLTLSSCFTHKEGDEKAGSKAEFPLRQPSRTSVLGDGSHGGSGLSTLSNAPPWDGSASLTPSCFSSLVEQAPPNEGQAPFPRCPLEHLAASPPSGWRAGHRGWPQEHTPYWGPCLGSHTAHRRRGKPRAK